MSFVMVRVIFWSAWTTRYEQRLKGSELEIIFPAPAVSSWWQ